MKLNWRAILAVLVLGFLLMDRAHAAIPCGPLPDPNGSQYWVDMNSDGIVVLYYCRSGDGWVGVELSGNWADMPGDWLYQIPALQYSTLAVQNAAVAKAIALNKPDAPSLKALLVKLQQAHDKDYPPPKAAASRLVVQPESKTIVGDRPVYAMKADSTRNTTAVKDVRIRGKAVCGTKRIGQTNYYSVQGQLDTRGYLIGDYYAVCVAP